MDPYQNPQNSGPYPPSQTPPTPAQEWDQSAVPNRTIQPPMPDPAATAFPWRSANTPAPQPQSVPTQPIVPPAPVTPPAAQLPYFMQPAYNPQTQVVTESSKSFVVACLLSFYAGVFGVDRMYLGRVGSGIAKLLTGGGLGLWAIVDSIRILSGSLRTPDNLPLQGRAAKAKLMLALYILHMFIFFMLYMLVLPDIVIDLVSMLDS